MGARPKIHVRRNITKPFADKFYMRTVGEAAAKHSVSFELFFRLALVVPTDLWLMA